MLFCWWERVDSDHRSKDATDLQSAPFGHSGTLPHIKFPLPETFLPPSRTKMRKTAGAGGRTRTPDLLITNQLLYQLSYTSKLYLAELLDYYITVFVFCQAFFKNFLFFLKKSDILQ